MAFCARCGHSNPEESRFCGECGAPLSAADSTTTVSLQGLEHDENDGGALSAGDQDLLDNLAPGSALLVVRRGPNSGSRFPLEADVTTVGRHPDSDIFLDDVTVSRRHAEFVREDGGFLVRDVGSLNATYVNRERVESARLASGDEVQIGKYRLAFMTRVPTGTSHASGTAGEA